MAYRRTPAVQERIDASRTGLVTAATQLVGERGYAGCSVAEVAARAGVATGTVYRHFPTKGELFAEVFRGACRREVDAATAAGAAARTRVDAVLATVRTFADRALRAPRSAYALLAEPVDPLVDAERLVFRETYADVIAAQIAAGVAAGEIPEQDPAVTAACLVGAIGEALVLPLARGTADPDIVAALERFTRRALGTSTDGNAP